MKSFVRWLARVTCRLFYRVDRAGTPPREGALLLLPNHPNALLDPAVIWATAGRDIRFLAKSGLFEGPLKPLVAGSGAIPVYRRIDEGADVSKNAGTFSAVDRALADGDAICLFPEGISHSSGRLVPLRTGAARMALTAAHNGVDVALVPVGLNFERKTTFRSRVTVVYGRPFHCADLAGSGAAPEAVRALTARIAERMRRLLIESDARADAALIERVDRLYAAARGQGRDPHDRVVRRRIIAGGIERLRASHPDRYDELLLRFRRYDERLHRFGLRDRHLDWQMSSIDALGFAVRESVIGIVLLPLSAVALGIFVIPYHLTGYAARWFTREADVAATAKAVSGFLIYAAWVALITVMAWIIGGRTTGMVTFAVVLAVAFGGLFAIERESAVLDAVRAWFLLRRTKEGTRERLRRQRSDLADVLDEVNQWLNSADIAE
jgi:glycerol-3-phosphate O-acyltransferase/dihydroxyacetone phosphate acyltransferase